MTTKARNSLRKLLELGAETWKEDHEELKRSLWKFEDNLVFWLGLYKVVRDQCWAWHDRVGRGVEAFDPEREAAFKAHFAGWLLPAEMILQRLEQLEDEYGTVERGGEFRRCLHEAQQVLETWKTPQPRSSRQRLAPGPVSAPAHTAQALTMTQMAEQLDQVSRPAAPSVPLKHPPDYNQVF